MAIENFKARFSSSELQRIRDVPVLASGRHPTWYPLFCGIGELEAVDYCLGCAVDRILRNGDESWLGSKKDMLLDVNTWNNASAALAEIRAYGGLLEAGFDVVPVDPINQVATPDFHINVDGARIEVEVAAKHQDEDQEKFQNAIHEALHSENSQFPNGVDHRVYHVSNMRVKTVVSVEQPGGAPDPTKPHDSVQTNVISRICGIKKEETQISGNYPSILIVDLTSFGGRHGGALFGSEQTAPMISGHHGLTSGALWYAVYGWKDAPVLEEAYYKRVRMQHDGRFRIKNRSTKYSAVLYVLSESSVLLENPWAKHRLRDDSRFALCRYPWFDLTRSICDWKNGLVERQIELQRESILALEERIDEVQSFGF